MNDASTLNQIVIRPGQNPEFTCTLEAAPHDEALMWRAQEHGVTVQRETMGRFTLSGNVRQGLEWMQAVLAALRQRQGG